MAIFILVKKTTTKLSKLLTLQLIKNNITVIRLLRIVYIIFLLFSKASETKLNEKEIKLFIFLPFEISAIIRHVRFFCSLKDTT